MIFVAMQVMGQGPNEYLGLIALIAVASLAGGMFRDEIRLIIRHLLKMKMTKTSKNGSTSIEAAFHIPPKRSVGQKRHQP